MSERPMVEVFETPVLLEPVLVLAMDGWIDAAGAARDARLQLVGGDPGRRIARFDTDRLLDHRARRTRLAPHQQVGLWSLGGEFHEEIAAGQVWCFFL